MNINAFYSYTQVTGFVNIENLNFGTFTALNFTLLTRIGDYLEVKSNPHVTLVSFASLTWIGGGLAILQNYALKSIAFMWVYLA
jgi:hypothetical protein